MFIRVYLVISSLALVILTTAAFRQAAKPQNLGEITVERINVVDANGTLRLVIANKDRMHPGVMDGVTIDRPRPVAGLLFFHDEGDEVGPRRVFGGKNAGRAAHVSLSDASGRPRLTLTVDASGNSRIEFLDEDGKIIERIPQ